MKKRIMRTTLLLTMLFWGTISGKAQFEVLSMGPNYENPFFYDIENGTVTTFSYSDWDIAFAVQNQRDLGIFVNEGVSSSSENPEGEVSLFVTASRDFETTDTTGMERIYNDDVSWDLGAFNHVASPGDPFDFGWGSYDPVSHNVLGTRVFIIQLRDGSFRKLKVESLIRGTYTFTYANLDGSGLRTQTLNKGDFEGKTLGYFSFAKESVVDLEPVGWDLLFTRYVASVPFDDGSGETLDYVVTGTLSNRGLQVAQVDRIDVGTVKYEDYLEQFSDTVSIIGYDWKEFDINTFQWSLPTDRVYFLQNDSGEVWKIQFIDFEGSLTGGFTFEKNFEGVVTSVTDLARNFKSFQLGPNPVVDQLEVQVELKTAARSGTLGIVNNFGQLLWQTPIEIGKGQQSEYVPVGNLPAGLYFLSIRSGADFVSRPFVKQ